MAKDILSALNNPVADHSKNVFDNSATHTYSTPLGMVKILDYFHTVPDASYRLRFDELVHTKPFVTDPFIRLKKHIDVWFVPFSSLWHGWENFLSQSSEVQTSRFGGSEYIPYFNMQTMVTILNAAKTGNVADMMGYPAYQSMCRMLDDCGYGALRPDKLLDYDGGNFDDLCLSIWNVFAYNKIWNFAYRDAHHTSPLPGKYFNADILDCNRLDGCEVTNSVDYSRNDIYNIFSYKYRKSRSDVFHSAQTSRQFGAVSSVSFNKISILNADPNGSGTNAPVYTRGTDGAAYQGTNQSDDWNIPSAFDVYAMKRAEMLQAYNEQLGRAGNSVTKRAKAIYGVEPRSIAKDDPVLVGATSFDIRSNQVTATGESSVGGRDVNLGDIAGKGIGFTGENFMEFKSTEYGVLMAVTYVLPDLATASLGVDKLNTYMERFDFFTPQLMNLGLEEVVQSNLALTIQKSNGDVDANPSNPEFRNRVLGYLPRYWPYKVRYDKAHLGFANGASALACWVPTHKVSFTNDYVLLDYYVDPSDYDHLFGESYDGSYLTDPFVCNCRVDCKAVLPMTELGLVNW